MKVTRVTLQLQNMAASEIEGHIEPGVLERIKTKDSNPLFNAYSIAHEGISEGNVIGLGKVALKWLQNSIVKIFSKVKIGTKMLYGHKPGTNEHRDRPVCGEVVGKAIEKKDNITHALAIGYIYPEHRDKKLDVASFEGDVDLPDNLLNTPVIEEDKISEITGIALGDSEKIKPAFKGAVLQTALQMFDEGGIMPIKIEDVLAYLKENPGVHVSSIVDKEHLAKDPVVIDLIQSKNSNTWHQIERLKAEKITLQEKHDAEMKDLKDKSGVTSAKLLKIESVGLKDDILKERKFKEPMVKFINKRFKVFEPKDPEKVKSELNEFVDNTVDEYKELVTDGIIPDDTKKKDGVKARSKDDDKDRTTLETDPDLKKAEEELMGD